MLSHRLFSKFSLLNCNRYRFTSTPSSSSSGIRLTASGPRCLVLHPVSYPNKGPVIEQYLAEQAIGLVKSLKWEVVPGPFWKGEPKKKLYEGKLLPNSFYMEPAYGKQIKQGTYVRSTIGNGMIYKGGIVFDDFESQSDGDLYAQWQNKKIRQSLANASLVKCRRITQKFFFTKGKLQDIIAYVLKKQPDCLFVNTELKPGQMRNLKKLLQSQLNNKNPPKGYHSSPDQALSQSQLQSSIQQQHESQNSTHSRRYRPPQKTIQIFDRFSIILQIFSKRTTSKLSKLQIQLSFLAYLRTRLVRDGSTYSSNFNLFSGDLLNATEKGLEVISAKQRRAIGTMSGQGESQLEIERRRIRDKEAQIKKQIANEERLRAIKKDKDKSKNFNLPIIALVGYTNVGKSAFMNYVMGKEQVESKDLLFQTLKTTSRFVQFPSGAKAMLLDTIGFITDLPIQMVDAFKSTLEDISHADIVIHLRDLSNPQNQLQKQSVISILKQLKFSPQFYSQKMIQVWNKVDLVQNPEVSKNSLMLTTSIPQQSPQLQSDSQQIFHISCKTGQGISHLLNHLQQKIKKNRNSSMQKITYSFSKHGIITQWLRKVGNISGSLNQQHNYQTNQRYPQGSVTISFQSDQKVYNKLKKFMETIGETEEGEEELEDDEKEERRQQRREERRKQGKRRKGMPPKEGW